MVHTFKISHASFLSCTFRVSHALVNVAIDLIRKKYMSDIIAKVVGDD